jgi:3-hydroxyisobutyrate dehydrogenase-like beta-hydroxyacid dehydrogenase
VLSLVGGTYAAAAAESVAPFLRDDAVYADMNAGDPAVKRQIAEKIGAHRFADVSVMGSVPAHGAAAAVVVSGAGSNLAARVFAELGALLEDIGGAPGDASARKLLRSTFMKGLGALIVEASAAGRAAGAEEWVRTQIANELAGGEAALDRLHDGTVKHASRGAPPRRPPPTWSAPTGSARC